MYRWLVMATRRKFAGRRDRKPHVIAVAAILSAASRYCRAAERDERRGYSYAAAFEWRKAAEFLGSMPTLANQCWQQWERLMRLPRHLAAPIGGESPAVSQLSTSACAEAA